MTTTRIALSLLFVGTLAPAASAQLFVQSQFSASQTGSTCGLARWGIGNVVYAARCGDDHLDRYDDQGTYLGELGSLSYGNDIDIEAVTFGMTLGSSFVPAGSVLLFEGEVGRCEVYALDRFTGAVRAFLRTDFGNSHVVGGTYSPVQDRLVLLQDRVPGPSGGGNRIAIVDPHDGSVESTFSTAAAGIDVYFGDLDVSEETGNIHVVSSSESVIAVFDPQGNLLEELVLPQGVDQLSGIALDDYTADAWVTSRSGDVFRLGNAVQVGEVYCSPAVPNSTGEPGRIRMVGTPVRTANNLRLVTSRLPIPTVGLYIGSQNQGYFPDIPNCDGPLCVAGNIARYAQPTQIITVTANRPVHVFPLDLDSIPIVGGGYSAAAGETWNFQAWYRDSNPAPVMNFTDAVSVILR